MEERDLVCALDAHDALVLLCARGDMSYEQFERDYDNFFQRWALDGHESGPTERQVLLRHASRIQIHRRVWDEVLAHATSEELAHHPGAKDRGFFGPAEARQLLRTIALEVGLLAPKAG